MARRRTRLEVDDEQEQIPQHRTREHELAGSATKASEHHKIMKAARAVALLASENIHTWVKDDKTNAALTSWASGGLGKGVGKETVGDSIPELPQSWQNGGSEAIANPTLAVPSEADNLPSNDMDMEYKSFMDDLEMSGLLEDKDEFADATGFPVSTPQADLEPEFPGLSNGSRDEASVTSSEADGILEQQQTKARLSPELDTAQPDTHANASQAADVIAPQASATHRAEQQVLGDVEGAEGWQRVKDEASGKIYFWHVQSNSVAWEPPPEAKVTRNAETDELTSTTAPKVAVLESRKSPEPAERSHSQLESRAQAISESNLGPETSRQSGSLAILKESSDSAAQTLADSRMELDLSLQFLLDASEDLQPGEGLSAAGVVLDLQERLRCVTEISVRSADLAALRQVPELWQNEAVLRYYIDRLKQLESKVEAAMLTIQEVGGEPARSENEDQEDGELPGPQNVAKAQDPSQPASAAECCPPLPREAEYFLPEGDEPTPPGEEQPPLPGFSAKSGSDANLAPPLPEDGLTADDSTKARKGSNSVTRVILSGPSVLREPSFSSASADEMHTQAFHTEEASESALNSEDVAGPGKRKRDGKPVVVPSKRKLSKGTSKLINKWATVQRTMEDETAETRVLTDKELEAQRMREAEKWRATTTDTPEDNPNLQPLKADWRQKVAAARAAKLVGQDQNSGQSSSAAPASVTQRESIQNGHASKAGSPDGMPDLERITMTLPTGWQAMWDASSKAVYYGNLTTKETTWEVPV